MNDRPSATPHDFAEPIEVRPRDISGLRRGNFGTDYAHRFASGRAGPSVHINALTHGNEFCGVSALLWIFEHGLQPRRGTLTLSFANVAAYERFDPARPLDNRFVDRDFNRVWAPSVLDSGEASHEVRRARELLPAIEAADVLLDIHSTSQAVAPFFVYRGFEKNRRLALEMGVPRIHLLTPGGKHEGGLLIGQRTPLGGPVEARLVADVRDERVLLQDVARHRVDVVPEVIHEVLAHARVQFLVAIVGGEGLAPAPVVPAVPAGLT